MERYNITGMRGQFRYLLCSDLSNEDAVDLRDELNAKNEFVKASIQLIEDVRAPLNEPVDGILNRWLKKHNVTQD